MKKKWSILILISIALNLNAWGQAFTRTDLEQKKDQELERTIHVKIHKKEIGLIESLIDESGELVWDKATQWPVIYKKDGHMVGEQEEKKGTTLTLIYSDELLEQFTSELEMDEYLRKAYEQAEQENNTKCSDGFTNYKALALETSKDFSEVFQAICF